MMCNKLTKWVNRKHLTFDFVINPLIYLNLLENRKTFNFTINLWWKESKKVSQDKSMHQINERKKHLSKRSLTLSHETKKTKRNYAKGQTNSPKPKSDDNDIPRIAFILLHQSNHPEPNNIHHVLQSFSPSVCLKYHPWEWVEEDETCV